jgi:hypothetical protein
VPLAPYETELSILIPRSAIDNDLKRLSNDLRLIDRDIKFFSEIVEKSRPSVQIKQIATTDPLFILGGVSIGTLLLILEVIQRVQKIIQNVESLREAKAKVREANARADIVEAIQKNIEEEIDKNVIELAKWVVAQGQSSGSKKDPPRLKELETEARAVLKDIASRIDNGYQIEGDAGDIPPAPDADVDQAATDEQRRAEIAKAKELSRQIQYHKMPSEPVLSLPAPSIENEENGDGSETGKLGA